MQAKSRSNPPLEVRAAGKPYVKSTGLPSHCDAALDYCWSNASNVLRHRSSNVIMVTVDLVTRAFLNFRDFLILGLSRSLEFAKYFPSVALL